MSHSSTKMDSPMPFDILFMICENLIQDKNIESAVEMSLINSELHGGITRLLLRETKPSQDYPAMLNVTTPKERPVEKTAVQIFLENDRAHLVEACFDLLSPQVNGLIFYPDPTPTHRTTLLQIAVRHGAVNSIAFLLKAGADLNAWVMHVADHPLWQAVSQDRADIARVLIEHGVMADLPVSFESLLKGVKSDEMHQVLVESHRESTDPTKALGDEMKQLVLSDDLPDF
ncbi:hypothetical protein F4778DRAFT_745365 [Xylariomycetidae sp. FL2044]|nr:hypothetical protein F4778DRAFT_745365 [Xylariomycetidae sp. FL2044]